MAGIPLALNFDLGAPLPLDGRQVIDRYSNLNTINPKYSGMQVYAVDTKKLYYLEDLSSNQWSEIGTGSFNPNAVVYTTGNQNIGGNKNFNGGFIKFLTGFTNDTFAPNRGGLNTWELLFLNSGGLFGNPIVTTVPTENTTGVYTYFNFSGLEDQLDRHIRTQIVRLRTGFATSPKIPYTDFAANTTGFVVPYIPNNIFIQDYTNLALEDRLRKIESSGAFCILPNQKMGIGTFTPTEKLDVSGTIKTNRIRFGTPWGLGFGVPPIDDGVIMRIEDNPTGKFSITRGGFQQIPHGMGIVLEGGYIDTKRGYLTVGGIAPTSYSNATLVWTSRILSGTWKTDQRLLVNNTPVLISGDSTPASPDDTQILSLSYSGPSFGDFLPKTYLPNENKNIKRYVSVSSPYYFPIILPTGTIEQGRTVYIKLDGSIPSAGIEISGFPGASINFPFRLSTIKESVEFTYLGSLWTMTYRDQQNYVDRISPQVIDGNKNFLQRPTVNYSGVLLQGEVLTTLFNGDRAIKQIPVVGTNYSGATISGFLENMFFPYQNAIININDFTIYRYGVDLRSAITFTGSYQRRDDTVTGIAYMNGNNIISGPTLVNNNNSSADYGQEISFAIPLNASTSIETYKTRIYITRNGAPATGDSVNKRVRFEPVYFYGVSNNPNLGLGVSNLTNSNPSTYTYAFNSRPQSVTHSLQPNNQYIYFAYPSPDSTQEGIINWGNTLSSIFETTTNFEYIGQYSQLTPVTIAFPFKSLKYRIYRSNDLITLAAGQSLNLRFTFGG
jgi:hypothetical protein